MGNSRWFFSFSGLILVIGALAIAGLGINFGIDFESGTRITAPLQKAATVDQVRSTLAPLGYSDASIQTVKDPELGDHVVQIEVRQLEPNEVQKVEKALDDDYGVAVADFSANSVGPTFGQQIARTAVTAVIASLLLISIYIGFRFEWKFAVPVLIALAHDLLITAGVYALFDREVTTATVAALLTIMGYSLYDTVIVFDRIRENVPRMPRATFSQIANRSMSEVFTRSLATSFAVLLPVGSLLLFGGETLKDFAFALLVGVLGRLLVDLHRDAGAGRVEGARAHLHAPPPPDAPAVRRPHPGLRARGAGRAGAPSGGRGSRGNRGDGRRGRCRHRPGGGTRQSSRAARRRAPRDHDSLHIHYSDRPAATRRPPPRPPAAAPPPPDGDGARRRVTARLLPRLLPRRRPSPRPRRPPRPPRRRLPRARRRSPSRSRSASGAESTGGASDGFGRVGDDGNRGVALHRVPAGPLLGRNRGRLRGRLPVRRDLRLHRERRLRARTERHPPDPGPDRHPRLDNRPHGLLFWGPAWTASTASTTVSRARARTSRIPFRPPRIRGSLGCSLGRHGGSRIHMTSRLRARSRRGFGVSPVVGAILARRGFGEVDEARRFLAAEESHDPTTLPGVPAACELILGHIERGSGIAVFGDYDVDGVCSTAMLLRTLRALGADPIWELPSRFDEGYGLSAAAVERLVGAGRGCS